jgi:hypothetical protein
VNVLGDRASSTLPVTPFWPVPKHFRRRIISGANPITGARLNATMFSTATAGRKRVQASVRNIPLILRPLCAARPEYRIVPVASIHGMETRPHIRFAVCAGMATSVAKSSKNTSLVISDPVFV